jgi:hypothetical protein
MPSELGSGAAFSALVKAVCARRWVPSSSIESGVPVFHGELLWRARLWCTKDRAAYETMITKQMSARTRDGRREDPNPAPPLLRVEWRRRPPAQAAAGGRTS